MASDPGVQPSGELPLPRWARVLDALSIALFLFAFVVHVDANEDLRHRSSKYVQALSGMVVGHGFQVRVKRKNGSVFNARLYVSPLIDARGHQTGWMTSMTDITEPTRIREQLSASYERFTTVLEALVNAGGFRDFANQKKIVILRGSARFQFNYKEVIAGKKREQNIYLQPGDQIIVP